MKAAQELLIFPFPNFFTFFHNVVFERKKSISYCHSKTNPDKPQEKNNPRHDSGFTLTSVVVTFLGP